MGKGAAHWLVQRFTALAIIPLTFWFIYALIESVSTSYEEMLIWLKQPLILFLLVAGIVGIFWHARLGIQVIIEDYIHGETAQKVALLGMNVVIGGLVAICLISIVIIVTGQN
ncbi:MAG: succinate dehydrogenase, hydrophobic membrane anchor protein [Methylococcaceae bacterium TMED69]|nr:MAG: succinate dehydrogenase, hydrophobic membrane anchor protein [Methylococcaceae bacterium TMED69]|tara:strand:+ start:236 stop:574 length:339 start_codon:yes stop_codon:yes gene_type:complete